MLKQLLLVGLGGGLGSMLRYLASLVTNRFHDSAFPLATFSVNVLGCFILGLIAGVPGMITHETRLLFVTGFCGGFTTFSAFASENVYLFQNNNYPVAITYIGLSILTGLLGVWLGIMAARQF